MRPDHVVLVAGTGTEVGKTWFSVELLRTLRAADVPVAALKPAQSFDPTDGQTDADLLASACGLLPETVCPKHRWYEVPMAPPMAAEILRQPRIELADLVDELRWPRGEGVGVVESVGGVRSPIAHDGDTVDLAAAAEPDLVVLVADAGLGTINGVRLSVAALDGWPVVVVLNRFDAGDPLHLRNRLWLANEVGLEVVTDVDELLRARPELAESSR